MDRNEALSFISQMATDYCNSLPPASRRPMANYVEGALAVLIGAQPATAPAQAAPAPESPGAVLGP